MPSNPAYGRVLMLVAATACWGAGTVVTKQVLSEVPPLTLLPVQLTASCLFLGVAAHMGRARLAWSPQTVRLALLGVLNPGLAYAFGLLGLASITASMSVLLWAAEPALILVLAAALLREHVSAALATSIGIAVVGVVLVVYRPGVAGEAAGVTLTVAAVSMCALYTVLARRLLVDDASLPVVLVQQAAALCFAVVLVAAVQILGGDGWSTEPMSPLAWAGAAASGIIYYGAAFWFYLAGLRRMPASTAGAFLPLIPVFGVAVAHLTGERLDLRQWLGALLIVGATFAVASREPSRAEDSATST